MRRRTTWLLLNWLPGSNNYQPLSIPCSIADGPTYSKYGNTCIRYYRSLPFVWSVWGLLLPFDKGLSNFNFPCRSNKRLEKLKCVWLPYFDDGKMNLQKEKSIFHLLEILELFTCLNYIKEYCILNPWSYMYVYIKLIVWTSFEFSNYWPLVPLVRHLVLLNHNISP